MHVKILILTAASVVSARNLDYFDSVSETVKHNHDIKSGYLHSTEERHSRSERRQINGDTRINLENIPKIYEEEIDNRPYKHIHTHMQSHIPEDYRHINTKPRKPLQRPDILELMNNERVEHMLHFNNRSKPKYLRGANNNHPEVVPSTIRNDLLIHSRNKHVGRSMIPLTEDTTEIHQIQTKAIRSMVRNNNQRSKAVNTTPRNTISNDDKLRNIERIGPYTIKSNADEIDTSNIEELYKNTLFNRNTNSNKNKHLGTTTSKSNENVTEMSKNNDDSSEDKWIWGGDDKKETKSTSSTTDVTVTLDDRAAFNGDKCATGMVRVAGKCVEVD